MKNLSTIVKLATLCLVGGGTIGAAVGISEAQNYTSEIRSEEIAQAETIDADKGGHIKLEGLFKRSLYPNRGWSDNTPYFSFIDNEYRLTIDLKKDDIFRPYCLNNPLNHDDWYRRVRYHTNLGPYFESDGSNDNNIKVKEDGTYILRLNKDVCEWYDKEGAWLEAKKVELEPINVKFNFAEDDNPQNLGVYIFGASIATNWNDVQTIAPNEQGEYIFNFANDINNGNTSYIITSDKWKKKTADLDLSSLKNLDKKQQLSINLDIGNGEGQVISSTFNSYDTSNSRLTNDTARIWVDPTKCTDLNLNNSILSMHLYNSKDAIDILPSGMHGVQHGKARDLLYFDAPVKMLGNIETKFIIKELNKTTGGYIRNTDSQTEGRSLSDFEIGKVIYINSDFTTKFDNARAYDGYKIAAAQFAKVLEAFYTCDSSVYNGFGAFPSVATSWLNYNFETKDYDWSLVHDLLSNYTIKDFKNFDTASYVTGNNKVVDIDLYTKLTSIEKQYTDSLNRGQKGLLAPEVATDNALIITTAVLSGVSLIAVTGFILVSKKKRKLI